MRHGTVALAVLAVLSATPAWAQEEADRYRTAVSVVGGLSVGSSRPVGGRGRFGFGGDGEAAFAVGGGVAHDVSPRLTVEATGLYLDRGVDAWSADAGLRLNLMPSREKFVPYFAVSGGLHGQSGETLRGRDDDFGPRDLRVPFGGNPQTGRGQPGRNPVRGIALPATGRGDTVVDRSSSTDAMLTMGGGIRLAAGPHVFVRPDVRAQVVFDGDTRVLGLFTLNFGYRF